MSHTSRMSALLRSSIVAATPSLESELPVTPEGEIATTPANGVGDGPLDTIVVENGELDKPATVSIEDAELSGDVADAEAALDAGNGAVDQLEGAETTLTRTANLAESTLDDGGMTPQTAEAVTIAVDGVRETLGVDESPVPATESFGGASTRYEATVASLEAITDMAKRVGHAIMEAVARVREFLGNLFNKLIEFLGSLERRNKSLAGKLQAAKTAKSRSAHSKIDIGDLYARINVKGKVDLGELAKLPGLISAANSFDEASMKHLTEEYTFMVAVAAGGGGANHARMQVELDAVPTGVFRKEGNEYVTDVLPGNVRFKVIRNGAATGSDHSFSDVKGAVSGDGSVKDKAGAAGAAAGNAVAGAVANLRARFANSWKVVREDLDAPAADGATDALTDDQVAQVIKIVDDVVAARKNADGLKKANALNFKEIRISENLSKEDQAAIRAAMSKFVSRIGTANQASAKVIAYAARAAAAFQTYAFKSLAADSKTTSGGAVAKV